MKAVSFSRISLIVSLAVGIMVLWVTTVPSGVDSDRLVGGWVLVRDGALSSKVVKMARLGHKNCVTLMKHSCVCLILILVASVSQRKAIHVMTFTMNVLVRKAYVSSCKKSKPEGWV